MDKLCNPDSGEENPLEIVSKHAEDVATAVAAVECGRVSYEALKGHEKTARDLLNQVVNRYAERMVEDLNQRDIPMSTLAKVWGTGRHTEGQLKCIRDLRGGDKVIVMSQGEMLRVSELDGPVQFILRSATEWATDSSHAVYNRVGVTFSAGDEQVHRISDILTFEDIAKWYREAVDYRGAWPVAGPKQNTLSSRLRNARMCLEVIGGVEELSEYHKRFAKEVEDSLIGILDNETSRVVSDWSLQGKLNEVECRAQMYNLLIGRLTGSESQVESKRKQLIDKYAPTIGEMLLAFGIKSTSLDSMLKTACAELYDDSDPKKRQVRAYTEVSSAVGEQLELLAAKDD